MKPVANPAPGEVKETTAMAADERDWKKLYEDEREAKRHFADALIDLVTVSRRLCHYQPAVHAKDQKEADLWSEFYRLVNEAPVT